MPKLPKLRYHPFELLIVALVFGIIFTYTYAFFTTSPYIGFTFSTPSGYINEVFTQSSLSEPLKPGDQILAIGEIRWSNYLRREADLPFDSYAPGDILTLSIFRQGEQYTVLWEKPGFNSAELFNRIKSLPWLILPYLFWLAGSVTLLLIRPFGQQRNLLAAFFFITAIWLVSGALSGMQTLGASRLFHFSLWIAVPITWHLHWIIIRPLKPLKPWAWPTLYLVAITLAVLDVLRILPGNPYRVPIFLLAAGSLIILVIHWYTQRDKRSELTLLISGFGLAVTPGIMRLLSSVEFLNIFWIDSLSIWSLVLIPITYFYVMFSRQLGRKEMRVSNAISLFFYGITIFAISYLSTLLIFAIDDRLVTPITSIVIVTLLTGIFTSLFYPHYQRWIERNLLHIPYPPHQILEQYANQIISALSEEHLVSILSTQIFPSLRIRQAGLLRIQAKDTSKPWQVNGDQVSFNSLLQLNINQMQLPTPDKISLLLSQAGLYLPRFDPAYPNLSWIRLALPLKVDQDVIGICLLGQRDPDDYYAITEIPTLQAIMDYTALALIRVDQNRLLRNLFQDDIERNEQERSRLALELHDDVLGQMALLAQYIPEGKDNKALLEAYQASVQKIRKITSGLRPPLLNYGLGAALTGLVDEFNKIGQNGPALEICLTDLEPRYPPEVELHLYRIIQEACQNAVKHANPGLICIDGVLKPELLEIVVDDNGSGIEINQPLDFGWLLVNHHFGLVGMLERAELIDARITIKSKPEGGTQVRVTWQAPGATFTKQTG